MNSENVIEMFMQLMREIHDNTDALKTIISNHETRIVVLEQTKKSDASDWRTQLLMLLAKAVVIGAVAIGSLAGAGGLLQKIVGG